MKICSENEKFAEQGVRKNDDGLTFEMGQKKHVPFWATFPSFFINAEILGRFSRIYWSRVPLKKKKKKKKEQKMGVAK